MIIGAPPPIHGDHTVSKYYENMIKDSMFLIKLYPAKPHVAPGPQLFVVDSGSEVRHTYTEYVKTVLEDIGAIYTPFNFPLQIGALADTAPSESFSASYDQSFLAKFGNVASTGVTELTQVLGARNMKEIGTKINQSLHRIGTTLQQKGTSRVAGAIGGVINNAGLGIQVGAAELQKIASKFGKTFADMLAGYKINFPKVWTGASYSPNYTFTIRLYNPDPSGQNVKLFSKYILQPLLMLLLFVVPISKKGDEVAYNWPFFCQATAPGMFKIRSGAITDISVVKGGDNNSIGYTQIAGIIDIRITIIDLYEVMIAQGSRNKTASLEDYLDIMKQPKPVYDYGEGRFKEEKIARNTMSAISTPDRSPTRQVNTSQTLAYNMLQSELITNSLDSKWPKDIPTPSPALKSYIVALNDDPDVQNQVIDFNKAMTLDTNSIVNDINNLPDSNSPPPSTPTLLARLNTKTVPTNTTNPVSQYMQSNPTSSNIANTILAQNSGPVNRAHSILEAKRNASAIVRSKLNPTNIKKQATNMLADVIQPKITDKCKEEIPSITTPQIASISKISAESFLNV